MNSSLERRSRSGHAREAEILLGESSEDSVGVLDVECSQPCAVDRKVFEIALVRIGSPLILITNLFLGESRPTLGWKSGRKRSGREVSIFVLD